MSTSRDGEKSKMEDDERPVVTEKPKKRPSTGRKRTKSKQARLSDHQTGQSCGCSRLKCFDNVTESERKRLLEKFNTLPSKNEQDSFLASMISVTKPKRRRPRKDKQSAKFHDHSYTYTVLLFDGNDESHYQQICVKAVCAIFDIGISRLERIRKALATTGFPPIDQQGRHNNRPHAVKPEQLQEIIDHISSFRGRKSHYSLSKSKRLYLPDELNIMKMYNMYCGLHPDSKVSYETYRCVFNEKFNISFGYPRQDTCSTCDEFEAKIQHCLKIVNNPESEEEKNEVMREKAALTIQKTLHLKKAAVFYDRKRKAKKEAQVKQHCAAIAFDFQKNLPSPNISTNDVYYRRQLSVYSFNIHALDTNDVYLYCYDETTARKGGDDVSSMLYNYFINKLSPTIKNLELFCDSCGGQNKNWTVFRMLYYMVHVIKRFESIKITFPIRGHSYMECDKDMGLLNQKTVVQKPDGWVEAFRTARATPTPFNVIEPDQDIFYNFGACLTNHFRKSSPMATRPIREMIIDIQEPRLVKHRDAWNGAYETSIFCTPKQSMMAEPKLTSLYTSRIPIKATKYADLMVLSKFCDPEVQTWYADIPKLPPQEKKGKRDKNNNVSDLDGDSDD